MRAPHELRRSYMATVRALSNAVEARDAYTRKHAERVTAYGLEIARAYGLPGADSSDLEFGFLLHDIGKLAIPDSILYKPGRLTQDERALMVEHPVVGAEIVRDIEFLAKPTKVVRHHHERWDGTGYPDGLAGEEIPLTGSRVRGRRRARRADQRPAVSLGLAVGGRARDDRRRVGIALRPDR